MMRFKIYDLRFKIFLLIFLLLFINHKSLFINRVLAADSTPSADIKSKLEELKKEIASKAALLKQAVDRKLRNKAYIGKIKSKSDTSLTLASASGPKIVSVNQDTVFENSPKPRQKISLKTIVEENYIAALGDTDETGVLTAKKIILLPEAKSEILKAYLWGQIISISDGLATLKNRESKNVAVSLPKGSTVKLNDLAILTGVKDKNEIFKAGFVYVKKSVSPEATRSATPAAKPTSR